MHERDLSQLRGLLMVSLDEGRNLGKVSDVYIDPESLRISAFLFKHRKRGCLAWARNEVVERVGRDVVLIHDANQVALGSQRPPGVSLKGLRGRPVVTSAGERVGVVADVEVDQDTGRILELHLDHWRTLPLGDSHPVFGPHEIIVPHELVAEMRERPHGLGFMLRALGRLSHEEADEEAVPRPVAETPRFNPMDLWPQ